MKTRKPLTVKELHKLEKTRDPWAEAVAGLKDYRHGNVGRTSKLKVSKVADAQPDAARKTSS